MDQYFRNTGHHGIDMMRGSAATQVSLDYVDEADFIAMFRLGNLLSPALALLTDNTPFLAGQAVTGFMGRTQIWNDVDKERSMVVPKALDKAFGYADYADYILNAPAILVLDKNGNPQYTGEKIIAEIYQNQKMTQTEIEHILSMFFPDVRLKTFTEIRMADSMPLPYVLGYIALLKGIFYSDQNKAELLTEFAGISNQDVTAAKASLIAKGYEGAIYRRRPKDLLTMLLSRAENALAPEERPYLAPLKKLTAEETTLAKKYHENH